MTEAALHCYSDKKLTFNYPITSNYSYHRKKSKEIQNKSNEMAFVLLPFAFLGLEKSKFARTFQLKQPASKSSSIVSVIQEI